MDHRIKTFFPGHCTYYLFLAVVALLIACGSTKENGTTEDILDFTETDSNEATVEPQYSGFDFPLKEGDFWEFNWDYYENSWAQGSGNSVTRDFGIFRLTLGTEKKINEVSAFKTIVSGRSKDPDGDSLQPRWKYIAIADHEILGSENGLTLEPIFNAHTGVWTGGGFFTEFPDANLITASEGSINNDYISGPAIIAGRSDSQSQCEIIAGIRICGDDSFSYTEKEYYMTDLGPCGYFYYNTYSDCGGGFCSGATWETNIGLVLSSFKGDNATYDLETTEIEPNHPESNAQSATPPFDTLGQWIFLGDIRTVDSGSYHTDVRHPDNNAILLILPDWYKFSLGQQKTVKIQLRYTDPGSTLAADLDLYLFQDNGGNIGKIRQSVSDNVSSGSPIETIVTTLNAGTYYLAIQPWLTPNGRSDYTLTINKTQN